MFSSRQTRLVPELTRLLTDARDLMYREQRKRAEDLEESLLDHQGTIGQFRDLVVGLQV